MIPVATVLAGMAGFFAASERRGANSSREAGFIALSDVNTNALVANQLILGGEQLLIRAEIAKREVDLDLAMEWRSRTVSVGQGFLDLWGNATAAHDGCLDHAKAAFLSALRRSGSKRARSGSTGIAPCRVDPRARGRPRLEDCPILRRARGVPPSPRANAPGSPRVPPER